MGFDPLATDVLEAAIARGVMIATAESCTGGLIIGALTEIPGSSAVVDRGFITYSNAAKMEMLGVQAETLQRFGAVSEETAREMATGALSHSDATLAVAVTGIAGPGGSDHKPEGQVCFAISWQGQTPLSETRQFGAIGRKQVRHATVDHGLRILWEALTA